MEILLETSRGLGGKERRALAPNRRKSARRPGPHASSLGLQGLLLLPPLRENSHTSLLNESVPSNPEERLLTHTHAHACTRRRRSQPYPDLLTHARALVPEAVKQAAVFTGFTTSVRWASYNLTYIISTPSGQHFLEDASFIYRPPTSAQEEQGSQSSHLRHYLKKIINQKERQPPKLPWAPTGKHRFPGF